MIDIWAQCRASIAPQYLCNELIRVVESQEQIATNTLVDNLEEQELLEQLLEDSKPALPPGDKQYHYLLTTPFRYPPLKYGSRFGTRYEPSLFYGSHSLITALAEASYYHFLFWYGMSYPPASGQFVTQHTVFGVKYETMTGLQLQNKPFNEYVEYLIDPLEYAATQQVGAAMREYGIEAFEYLSARDTNRGLNAALFTPSALASLQPLYQQQWLCETNDSTVTFYSSTHGSIHKYPLSSYLVNGKFPEPAF